MPKTMGAPSLTSYDDIFNDMDDTQEKVLEIPLVELYDFENHPFHVQDDEAMMDMKESIERYGVLVPGIARQRKEGGYEMVAGHRRKRACQLAGKTTMPLIVRNMDDDEATIIMVDSNMQREMLLPSEKAWAYRMKLEAMNHRGTKGLQPGVLSVDILAEQVGESKSQIFRYMRLTELVPTLLDMVDEGRIAFNTAVELSYLSRKEQNELLDIMAKHECTPSMTQSLRLKQHSKADSLTPDVMERVIAERKTEPLKLTLRESKLSQYFPQDYTPKQMESIIIQLLEDWKQKQA